MNNPEVSIIIPVYQVEKYIKMSIKSICEQTFKNIEIIIVNDGTMDNSIKIAKDILQNYNVEWTVIDQENKGVSAARNRGIKKARGNWIICVDPDDIIHTRFIELLYSACISKRANISFCDFKMVTTNEIEINPTFLNTMQVYNQKEILKGFLRRQITIISPAMLIKKDFIYKNNLYYEETCLFSEDQHFIWQVLSYTEKIVHVKSKLYYYLSRENSTMTSSKPSKIINGYYSINKLEKKIPLDKKFKKNLVSRWVIGAIRSAAKISDYRDFIYICNNLNYRKHLVRLLLFPDIKVILLTVIMLLNQNLSYKLIRKFL